MVISIILAVAGLVIGGGLGYVAVNTAMKAKVARKLKEAEDQGENMKRNKLLEAKEKFLNMKPNSKKKLLNEIQKYNNQIIVRNKSKIVLNKKNNKSIKRKKS